MIAHSKIQYTLGQIVNKLINELSENCVFEQYLKFLTNSRQNCLNQGFYQYF